MRISTTYEQDYAERLAVITRKGQVTIPAEIRQALGLKRGDKVAFVIKDNEIRIAPSGSIAQRTAGMFKTDKLPLTAEELRRAAEETIAEGAVKRMGG